MKILQVIYYTIFNYIINRPGSRYIRNWFHLLGALAFLQSAIKHVKRRNKHLFLLCAQSCIKQILAAFRANPDPKRWLMEDP